jgi:hypothetical protein
LDAEQITRRLLSRAQWSASRAGRAGSQQRDKASTTAWLLRQGLTIVMDNDAFKHPALTEDIVSLGLAEAKRCARLVPRGFRLIVEEAGKSMTGSSSRRGSFAPVVDGASRSTC